MNPNVRRRVRRERRTMEKELDAAGYEVSLPVFEGPMDLLLHLVTKNRIDIHDIPIHKITDQYLDYLRRAEAFDLDLGSGFFAMAATLLLIKSRILLPKRRQEEDGADEDPRQELARSLEEFRRMKEMRQRLEELLAQESPYRMREPAELRSAAYAGRISVERLTAAFFSLFEEKEKETPRVLSAEEVTFDRQAEQLRAYLHGSGWRPMRDFFMAQPSRLALAVSLVALLELIRLGEVEADEEAGGIVLRMRL